MIRCEQCGTFNRVPARPPTGQATCGRCASALDLAGHPQAVDDGGLARALKASPVPVLVDFWAPWCGPCVMAAPILDEIGRTFAGELLVLKVDTERAPFAAELHGIRGIPTFVMFDGGQERARQTGLLPRNQFKEWVGRYLVAAETHAGA